MDAPGISTLGDDTPSPPQPKVKVPTLKFRVRPLAPEPPPAVPPPAEGPLEEEDEVDQLADEEPVDVAESLSGGPFTTLPLKRRPSKPRTPRGKKRTAREAELHLSGPSDPPPTMSTFALGSPDASVHKPVLPPSDTWEQPPAQLAESASTGPSRGRKRGSGRGRGTGAPRVRKNVSKASSTATVAPALPQLDIMDNASEAYSETAASSPGPPDFGDLEPDILGDSSIMPSLDDIKLDSVPVPIYPLPTKPFSVLPPAKIGTGFAPVVPLDRSNAKVRHWRIVNREVRGIAGGRWFAKAWIGDKESEYAAVSAPSPAPIVSAAPSGTRSPADAAAAAAIGLPANPFAHHRVSSKKKILSASAAASSGPSRSGSQAPDAHVVRAPSKMRTSVVAPEVDSISAQG